MCVLLLFLSPPTNLVGSISKVKYLVHFYEKFFVEEYVFLAVT